MRPVRIDCAQTDWENILREAVQTGKEAELMNFDYTVDGELCEQLAISHAMQFVLDPKARVGFFRKRV